MAFYPTTKEKLQEEIQKRIDETQAELNALKSVQINTRHNTLTNRAITTSDKAIAGARIGDYVVSKALFVSYTINYADGHRRYESATINAYTYNNPDGTEIGTEGIMRVSRLCTPAELKVVLDDVIESRASTLGELQSEYDRADQIVSDYNDLVAKVNKHNNSLSYAAKSARIQ